jgi:hypothetical protein
MDGRGGEVRVTRARLPGDSGCFRQLVLIEKGQTELIAGARPYPACPRSPKGFSHRRAVAEEEHLLQAVSMSRVRHRSASAARSAGRHTRREVVKFPGKQSPAKPDYFLSRSTISAATSRARGI